MTHTRTSDMHTISPVLVGVAASRMHAYFFESRFSDGVHCSDEFSNCFLSLTVIIWWCFPARFERTCLLYIIVRPTNSHAKTFCCSLPPNT